MLGGLYMDMDMAAKRSFTTAVTGSAAVFPCEWWKNDEAFKERHLGALPRDNEEPWQAKEPPCPFCC